MESPREAQRLSELEDRYYRRWMTLAGETSARAWSKRRAMFWGLLVATDVGAAYEAGERIARNIRRPPSPGWSKPSGVCDWFLQKAAFASLFEIERPGKQRYRLVPRAREPWAALLQSLARAMHEGRDDPLLAAELPERTANPGAELPLLAQEAFGRSAMDALTDVIRDEHSADAAEFRLALERGAVEHARYWFEREWSLRAKERYRSQIVQAQSGKCACCGAGDHALQLNHRRKVRDWGPTRPENLEAVCVPCHRSIDRLGLRCH